MKEATVPGDVVEVEWIDSGGLGGWHDVDLSLSAFDKMHCRSVGYLIEDSERGIGLLMGTGATGLHMDSMAIPRVCVQTVTVLRKQEEQP